MNIFKKIKHKLKYTFKKIFHRKCVVNTVTDTITVSTEENLSLSEQLALLENDLNDKVCYLEFEASKGSVADSLSLEMDALNSTKSALTELIHQTAILVTAIEKENNL